MSAARCRIVRVGALATIQDAGRPGWRRFGVPPSGPVDRLAHAAANTALGNPAAAPAIEIAPGGLTLVCEDGEISVAIVGACGGDIDGTAIGGWTIATLAPGMRLTLRHDPCGRWGYLAFAGHLASAMWLGSAATHVLAGLGGGTLGEGDTLTIEAPRVVAGRSVTQPRAIADPICIVLGPQDRFFASDAIASLGAGSFGVGARFDRMGMALDGPSLPPLRIDMPSEPTLRGALQVDGDGRLTMLTADHQTTGGYPRIATVIDADVDRLAQRPAGAPVRFRIVTAEESIASARAARIASDAYLAGVRAAPPRPSLLELNLIGGVVDACASVGDPEI